MELMEMGAVLERAAFLFPERIMLDGRSGTMSYAEVHDLAARFATGLTDTGIGPGSRVVLVMRNRAEYVVALFGCSLAGAVPVPVNRRFGPRDLAHVIVDSEAAAVVLDDGVVLDELHVRCPGVRWVTVGFTAALPGARSYHDLTMAGPGGLAAGSRPGGSAPGAIHYTSGTTSAPKGVVRSHESNVTMALGSLVSAGFGRDDSWLLVLPMHSAAIHGFLLGAAQVGGRCVLVDYDEKSVGADLDDFAVTHCAMGPTMYYGARASLARASLGALRCALYGGMLPNAVASRGLEQVLPVPLLGSYGMTEATMATYSTVDVYASGRITSVGYPNPFMQVMVSDAEGRPCAPGEQGQVLLRGAQVLTEYLNLPALTARTIVDGWLHTGDMGHLDTDGALTLTGRVNDMIISGNENISPAEIEAVIARIPGVQQVAVVGLPSLKWGQEVTAFLVAEDVEVGAVQQHCRLHLSRYKVPKQVILVDDLPKDSHGKIRKRDLVARWSRPAAPAVEMHGPRA